MPVFREMHVSGEARLTLSPNRSQGLNTLLTGLFAIRRWASSQPHEELTSHAFNMRDRRRLLLRTMQPSNQKFLKLTAFEVSGLVLETACFMREDLLGRAVRDFVQPLFRAKAMETG